MTLSLRARVIVAMLLAVCAAPLVVAATVISINSSNAGMWRMSPEEVARCEADPARWSQAAADIAQVWAYDEAGRSTNPAAPALAAELVTSAREQGWASTNVGTRRVELRRVAPSGPCAIMMVSISPPVHIEDRFAYSLAAGVAVAFVLVVALAIQLVVQPLLTRIARIRAAAAAVGAPAFLADADPLRDDLGEISRVLDASHARITANEAELRARQRALERHLAEIAHDLRTPLASLLLAVQEIAPFAGATGRGAVGRALDDAEYVNALVDNLHQGALLREGLESRTGRTPLGEVCERLGVRFRALGALRQVEVACSVPDAPVLVDGNPALAERAVANLVHNAVRHGREGGHVALLLERTVDGFELQVVDDGPGLRPEDLATLQSATFLTETARRRGGGLGVAITNEVCRRLGWTIRFEPGEEGGLCVTIRGPVVDATAGRSANAPS